VILTKIGNERMSVYFGCDLHELCWIKSFIVDFHGILGRLYT